MTGAIATLERPLAQSRSIRKDLSVQVGAPSWEGLKKSGVKWDELKIPRTLRQPSAQLMCR